MADEDPEQVFLVLGEAQIGDVGPEVPVVEDPDDHLLPPAGHRSGRDAQVHLLPVHPHGGAAIVGMEGIGDIELGEDLDPAHQRGPGAARKPHDFAQHPVNPVPDGHRVGERLGVNVARAFPHSVADHRVHQLGHRRFERGVPLRRLGGDFLHRLDLAGVQAAEETVDRLLGAIGLVDALLDRFRRGDLQAHPAAGHEPERLLQLVIVRIGSGERDGVVVGGDRKDPVLAGQRLREQGRGARIGQAQIGGPHLEAPGQRPDDQVIGGVAALDRTLPDGLAVTLLQLALAALGHHPCLHQHREQPEVGRSGNLLER